MLGGLSKLLIAILCSQLAVARNASAPLITDETSKHIESLIQEWDSTGLAVAVVQKLPSPANSWKPEWKIEYGSYGLAKTSTGNPSDVITPDTLFSIASNSKLFLAISVGLIISNQSIADGFQQRTGKKLGWWTKMKDIMPEEWVLQDKEIEQSATIQDLVSHRTGMPRHDFRGTGKTQDVREDVSWIHSPSRSGETDSFSRSPPFDTSSLPPHSDRHSSTTT